MPRFHFEIIDGYRIEDPVGLDCRTEAQARQVAEDIARQIAIDVGPEAARKIVVINEIGSEICTVPVKG